MSKPKISLVQTYALMVGIIIGAGILNLPAALAQEIKQEGWIGAVSGGIAVILLLNLGIYLLNKFPGKNYLQISRHLLGKYLGTLLNLFLLAYFLLAAGTTLRISTSTISSWILPKTPLEILIFSFIAGAFYLTRYGLQTAARFSEMILFIVLPFATLIFFPIGNWKIVHLLPIGQQSLSGYLSASLISIYAYLGFEIILLFYPYIQAKHKQIRMTANLAVGFAILIYVSLTFGVIAAFGSETLQKELFVTLKYSQLTQFALIERVGFLLIFFWNFALFHTFGLLYYFSYAIIEDIFRIKKNNWSVFLAIPIYYIALYPENIAELSALGGFVSKIGLGILAGGITLLTGISFFKK